MNKIILIERKFKENKKNSLNFLNLRIFLRVLVLVIAVIVAKNYKPVSKGPKLRYWGACVINSSAKGSLRSMNRVFERLGYEFVNGSKGHEWDVLWAHDYPFLTSHIHKISKVYAQFLKKDFKFLAHQRVHHFPGCYYITHKGNLAIETKSKYLMPTFKFPENLPKFKNYVAQHPNAKFVEKLTTNRGVKQINLNEINFEASQKIYQVFMGNPFLLDGHFFDFGIHVLITSINPLRVYRYKHDVYLRFCPEKYHPFDPQNTRKYVINGDRLRAYEHPMFKNVSTYESSFTKIFERIIKEKGFEVKKFWEQVDDAISDILTKNEKKINGVIQKEFPNATNFFELVRFDFVFDTDLNPYVMEINMSPGLTPGKNEFYTPYYEQIIYNTLRLIGAESYYNLMSRISNDTTISNLRNLSTNIDECIELNCTENCDKPECNVCLACTDDFIRFQMQESYREHTRRGNFKRIFPTSVHFNDSKLIELLSPNNEVMIKWFKSQCEYDMEWC